MFKFRENPKTVNKEDLFDEVAISENPEMWQEIAISMDKRLKVQEKLLAYLLQEIKKDFVKFDIKEFKNKLWEMKERTGFEQNSETIFIHIYLTNKGLLVEHHIALKKNKKGLIETKEIMKHRNEFIDLLFSLAVDYGTYHTFLNIENTTMKNLQGKTINPDFKNISETDINKTEHNYFEYERIRFKEQALPVGFPEYLHKLFDMKKSFDLEKNPLTHRISFYGYVYENRLNPKYRNIDIYNKDIMENEFVKFNAAYKQYKPTMKKKKGE